MLFRIAYSVLYAVLLLSISGISTTAQAVVSCQDTITTDTTYRYSDALAFFTEFNGKTYAIAKSAVSGNQSLPDNYFAFSANISREYLMVGTDTASLKRILSLGQFGAARPVRVDSQQIQDFLIKRYGTYLGAVHRLRARTSMPGRSSAQSGSAPLTVLLSFHKLAGRRPLCRPRSSGGCHGERRHLDRRS